MNIQFNFVLSVAQILAIAGDILEQNKVLSIKREGGNSITFEYLGKQFTLVVYSAKAIVLSYYCAKSDYCGSQTFNSIENCFKALNHIATLEVQINEHEFTQPARIVIVQRKSWAAPKQVDLSPLQEEADYKVVGNVDLASFKR